MTENSNIPSIRFADFTDPWEQRKLEDYLTLSRVVGHTGLNARKLTVKLWGKGVVEKTDSYGGSANTQYYVRHAGQFMYGKLDFLHAAFGIVPEQLDGYESTLDSPAFDMSGIDGLFLLNRVTQQDFYLRNGMIANGSRKAKRIHEDTFLDMSVLLPSLAEQQAIGNFFSHLDDLITLHQRKYDKLVVFKKAMLEQMFPQEGETVPKIRFAGFTDPWEQRKLGELYEKSSEKNDGSFGTDKVISVANMRFNPSVYVTDDDYLRTYNVMRLGDIAFEGNRSKYFAHGRFVENDIGDGIVSHVFEVLRPKERLDLSFWKYYIHDEQVMGTVLVRSTKATTMMHNIVVDDFLREDLAVPSSLKEQQAIGRFLSRLDDLITLHQRKLELLRNIKKSLLDKMFV